MTTKTAPRNAALAAAKRQRGVIRERATTTWTKDPGGRRQRVLDEATRLFSERGYAAVSTSEVARAAGVAEGSVFHYFGSKQELLRAVGERYGGEFAAAMFSGVEPVASPATIEKVVRRAFEKEALAAISRILRLES